MNELLVAAEKYERGEGETILLGRLVILARATSDIVRLRNSLQSREITPPELWAEAWSALRQGRTFILPGWWYHALVVAAGMLVAKRAGGGRTFLAGAGAFLAVFLGYLLAALGAFASAGVLLPFMQMTTALVAGFLLGRFALRT